MKGIHFVILTFFALSLVCCTSHEDELIEVPPTPTEPIIEDPEPEDTLVIDESLCTVTMPKIKFEGDEDEFATRSTIAFNYVSNPKIMKFSWEYGTDKIGVFPIINEHPEAEQEAFRVIELPSASNNSSTAIGTFGIYDDGSSAVFNGRYASYFPYNDNIFTHKTIPVTYLGQEQQANVNIQDYYKISTNKSYTTEEYNEYLASEIEANAHLCDYDYLVSQATSTTTGALHFTYSRMGSVVRFSMQVPDIDLIYDELQLINNSVNFMKTGTMSILNKSFTTLTEGHAMSLKLGASGFDFSDRENNKSYYRDGTLAKAHLIAYMFLAPINLDRSDVDNCYLYLLGRDKSGNRKYFKSSPLTKLNLQANYFYQWVPKTNPDEPITFVPTTVQEWEEGSGYTNQDGAGTQRW